MNLSLPSQRIPDLGQRLILTGSPAHSTSRTGRALKTPHSSATTYCIGVYDPLRRFVVTNPQSYQPDELLLQAADVLLQRDRASSNQNQHANYLPAALQLQGIHGKNVQTREPSHTTSRLTRLANANPAPSAFRPSGPSSLSPHGLYSPEGLLSDYAEKSKAWAFGGSGGQDSQAHCPQPQTRPWVNAGHEPGERFSDMSPAVSSYRAKKPRVAGWQRARGIFTVDAPSKGPRHRLALQLSTSRRAKSCLISLYPGPSSGPNGPSPGALMPSARSHTVI
ncbi:hypothetical protein G7Y89_g14220 [Cudoniella acicularis]|uniref:Uncharacterized protein n=1 Tax=Cudoniella acicularis TaxID=354080 RepID=A0A8H4R3I9_9HELO|nr:hypothetical protein G7Y89_g14220 [Cudoniella acicularis]